MPKWTKYQSASKKVPLYKYATQRTILYLVNKIFKKFLLENESSSKSIILNVKHTKWIFVLGKKNPHVNSNKWAYIHKHINYPIKTTETVSTSKHENPNLSSSIMIKFQIMPAKNWKYTWLLFITCYMYLNLIDWA